MLGPLWTCPACKRAFANRNQTHSCGRHALRDHFAGKPSKIAALFRLFRAHVRAIGPVRVLPEKTRIAFQVRMSFAQLTPRRAHVNGHLVLARRVEDPIFRKIEMMSPRCYVHHFRLEEPSDMNETFLRLLREAYAVGTQERLRK